jgi:hypothetical protein
MQVFDCSQDIESFTERKYPSKRWYMRMFLREFVGDAVVFLIFSDNIPRARKFMSVFRQKIEYVVIDEPNYIAALHLMSLCNHHILSSSSFGFWGLQQFNSFLVFVHLFGNIFFLQTQYPDLKTTSKQFRIEVVIIFL